MRRANLVSIISLVHSSLHLDQTTSTLPDDRHSPHILPLLSMLDDELALIYVHGSSRVFGEESCLATTPLHKSQISARIRHHLLMISRLCVLAM